MINQIERKLNERFFEIIGEHGNGKWTTDTLEYEVFEMNMKA